MKRLHVTLAAIQFVDDLGFAFDRGSQSHVRALDKFLRKLRTLEAERDYELMEETGKERFSEKIKDDDLPF